MSNNCEDSEMRTEVEVCDPEYQKKNKGKKYTIYPHTDLKYKNNRSLDIRKLIRDNPDIPELRIENMDTVEFRFKECRKNNWTYLDLSNLGLTEMPSKLPLQIKQLFLSDNKFTDLGDISYLTKLRVIDVCNNRLENLPNLPTSIEEITSRNNNLSNINCLIKFTSIKRLDMSHNKISVIPSIPKLEILRCSNNRLIKVKSMKSLKKLNVRNNNLETLVGFDSLEELDADKNRLNNIEETPNLIHLYANDNNLEHIPRLEKIKVLQIKSNKVSKVPYFKDLRELVGDYNKLKQVSKNYKILEAEVYKDNTVCIVFDIKK